MTLRELRVGDVAVVAAATLRLDAGFGVLTGETGAGKSVCINALRLALGGRVEGDVVRPSAETARVAAVFDGIPVTVGARLAELGVPSDELLTLSRELPRVGRSTCRLNGALVSQAALREIGEALVEVTAQGASQRLLRRSWQREQLDASGGDAVAVERERTEATVRALRQAEADLAAACAAARSDAAAIDRARELLTRLGRAALRAGEDEELAAESLRLRHANRIVEMAGRLADAAGGDETGAADAVAIAVASAEPVGALDPELGSLIDRGADLVCELRELALDARRHAESIIVDGARLAAVEDRLDLLTSVKRRHGSIETALAELEDARSLVAAADGGDDARARLEAEVQAAREAAADAADRLSAARRAAARRLEAAVTAELRHLELPHGRFRVALGRSPDPGGLDLGDGLPVRCTAHGVDDVEFRFAAGRGVMPAPLDEGPSGGELSRIALALSAVVAERDAPALVLDEIDTGIGGETAARVGDVLSAIGETRQILAVTHRPEIAARATVHLVVSKRDEAGRPVATVATVDGEPRVAEVARLMSGRATEAALRRAGELLEEGVAVREAGSRARSEARTM